MSSRVMRKLHNEKEIIDEISDPETDITITGGARRKQLNLNRYDLLNQQSHSESEVKEDDNETEATKSYEGDHEGVKRKKKKKKKKSGKHTNHQRSSEDNADLDEVERSVREVNRLLGEDLTPKYIPPPINIEKNKQKTILSIQHRNLNATNELKRIFGSKIVQADHKRRSRGSGRTHVRTIWMTNYKDNWPYVGKCGVSMNLVETKDGIQYFTYEHSQNYRIIQQKFLKAVESLNPDNIVDVINEHPYHLDSLIQLSDLCKLSEDLAMAAEFIERALYCLECCFHPLFNVAQGNCRLDYRRQENRTFYVTIFKHLVFVGGRACSRTSLEFCKLLLSLDPDGDPVAIKLAIDYYAIRAKEYQWFIEFVDEFDSSKNLLQLPNIAFSYALAHFYLFNTGDKSDNLFQNALIMFPFILIPLLEKCAIQIDKRVTDHDFFSVTINEKKQPLALFNLIQLYLERMSHVWKDVILLPWIQKNVHKVLDRVDNQDPYVSYCEGKRSKRYQGSLPRSILRHMILSDLKDLSSLASDIGRGVIFGYDPLPPTDAINIYTKPRSLDLTRSSSLPLRLFFRSILPSFIQNHIETNILEGNLFNENDDDDDDEDDEDNEEDDDDLDDGDGARALSESNLFDSGELRRSVASLVGAMRDLLNNISRPEMEIPNDADVDDDYDDLT